MNFNIPSGNYISPKYRAMIKYLLLWLKLQTLIIFLIGKIQTLILNTGNPNLAKVKHERTTNSQVETTFHREHSTLVNTLLPGFS